MNTFQPVPLMPLRIFAIIFAGAVLVGLVWYSQVRAQLAAQIREVERRNQAILASKSEDLMPGSKAPSLLLRSTPVVQNQK
jgi:hypothetical protein